MSIDKLIIDGVEIPDFDETECEIECSFGTQKYSIDLEIEAGSEYEKVIQKFLKNKDKYILEVNLKEKENENN